MPVSEPIGSAESDSALADRYGPPRRKLSRNAQKWGIIATLAATVAVVVWITASLTSVSLDYEDVGYTIEFDTRASVDYEVTKDFDATAQCMLQVLDDSYAVVGSRIVTIGPHQGSTADERSQYFRSDLRTEHLGVTGIVDSCWLLD